MIPTVCGVNCHALVGAQGHLQHDPSSLVSTVPSSTALCMTGSRSSVGQPSVCGGVGGGLENACSVEKDRLSSS